ncbi:Y-family DNA polymerase [Oceanobacter mangrovi]|uniref:Y-family DNA polymerase n=1 Tax=Oceanobacter mangrovi TaxID=2862510 RepID=UPI001C8E3E65|nr:DNA polymerase Y family protein [Oceanobacter mangrovi]
MKQLWLYLYYPDLYLHGLNIPPYRAVALIQSATQLVVQCNAKARQAGVKPEMSVATAASLCPSLHCLPFDPVQQQQLLEQKALWAYRFAAQICLDPPQGMWLEVGSMLQLFGGLEMLWRQIQQAAPPQWPLQLAVAPAAQAARLLAINQLGQPSTDTDGLRQRLHNLSLAQLQLEPALQLKLQRIGAKRLADLIKLPLTGLASRYGMALVDYLERIQGHRRQPMQWFEPPLQFQQETLFIEEVEHRNGLLFPLRPMLASLCGLLQQRQLATRSLTLQLRHRELPDTEWQLGFARHEHREQELLALLRYRLGQFSLPAPVTALRLSVDQFQPRQPDCQNDWSSILGSQQVPTDHSLLNRLQARLQHQQLFYLDVCGDPRPELAGSLLSIHQNRSPTPARRGLQRPLWLLHTPVPCQQPARDSLISLQPERICSGWWDNQPIRRDYYLSQQQGQLLWLFRDASQHWFIHGLFG